MVSRKKIKKGLLILLFIIPFFYPAYFETNLLLLKFKQFCTYLGIAYVGYSVIKNKNHIKISDYISLPILIILCYHIWQLISSKYNGIDISYDLHNVLWEIIFLVTLQYFINVYKNLAIVTIANWFTTLVFFNTVTVMLWTDHGVSPEMNYYLVGYRYAFCIIILASMVFNAYISLQERNTLISRRVFLNLGCAIITVGIIGPSTLTAGLIVFFVVYMSSKSRALKYNVLVPICCLFFPLFFQYFIIAGNTNQTIKYIVENILGRTMTYTGRTFIWKSVFDQLLQCNILYGFGNPLALGRDGWAISWWDSTRYVTAHNQFLQTLTTAGIIALIFEISLIIISVIYSWKYLRVKERALFCATVFSMLIMMTSTIMVPISYKEAIFVLISVVIQKNKEERKKILLTQ